MSGCKSSRKGRELSVREMEAIGKRVLLDGRARDVEEGSSVF